MSEILPGGDLQVLRRKLEILLKFIGGSLVLDAYMHCTSLRTYGGFSCFQEQELRCITTKRASHWDGTIQLAMLPIIAIFAVTTMLAIARASWTMIGVKIAGA